MRDFFQKIPNACAICMATLISAVVVMLQNADSYAERLEVAASALATECADLLRQVGSLVGATQVNEAEKSALREVSSWAEPQEPAATSPESTPAAEPNTPQPGPAEGRPASPPAPAEPADAPAHDAARVEPSPAEPSPRRVIPAPECRWWPALNTPWAEEDSLAARFHENKPNGRLLRRRGTHHRPAEPSAVVEPPPAPPAPPAEPAPAEPQEPVQPPAEPAPAEPQEPVQPPAPPTPSEAAAEEVLTQSPPIHYRLMVVGDSLMEDLGPRLHQEIRDRKGMELVVSAKFSTGLCRPQYFNWPVHLREQLSKHHPDMVVFFMGANDAMPVREGKQMVPMGGEPWREAYMRKMDELVSMAREAGAEVIWIEMPTVGNRYGKALRQTQIAQREYCERYGIRSIRTDEIFTGEWGRYEAYGIYRDKKVRLRKQDKVHLTKDGNSLLIEHLLPMLEESMLSCYTAHPERLLSEEELARTKKVPVTYTCKSAPAKPAANPAAKPAAPAPRTAAAPPAP